MKSSHKDLLTGSRHVWGVDLKHQGLANQRERESLKETATKTTSSDSSWNNVFFKTPVREKLSFWFSCKLQRRQTQYRLFKNNVSYTRLKNIHKTVIHKKKNKPKSLGLRRQTEFLLFLHGSSVVTEKAAHMWVLATDQLTGRFL